MPATRKPRHSPRSMIELARTVLKPPATASSLDSGVIRSMLSILMAEDPSP